MLGFIVDQKEGGANIVEGRSRMFAFMKNATSINAMEDYIKVVGLVEKTVIVIEDIGHFQPRVHVATGMGSGEEVKIDGFLSQSSGGGQRTHLNFWKENK
jgi:hypothetical protein